MKKGDQIKNVSLESRAPNKGEKLLRVVTTEAIEQVKFDRGSDLKSTLAPKTETLPLETYSLDESGITTCISRGATIPSLILAGVEIFYNDPLKRNDPSQSLRESFWMGPQAGPFTPEQNAAYGYSLKQHGFLRDVKRGQGEIRGNMVKTQFITNEDTMKMFPHDFRAEQCIFLGEKGARIELHIKNTSTTMMQVAPGHHTYYKVPLEKKNNIILDAVMGITEETKEKRALGQETVKIKNPGTCKVFIPGTGLLQLTFDKSFSHIWFRSEPGKGFVCIEPVVCDPTEREMSAITVLPKETLTLGFSIMLLAKDRSIE